MEGEDEMKYLNHRIDLLQQEIWTLKKHDNPNESTIDIIRIEMRTVRSILRMVNKLSNCVECISCGDMYVKSKLPHAN